MSRCNLFVSDRWRHLMLYWFSRNDFSLFISFSYRLTVTASSYFVVPVFSRYNDFLLTVIICISLLENAKYDWSLNWWLYIYLSLAATNTIQQSLVRRSVKQFCSCQWRSTKASLPAHFICSCILKDLSRLLWCVRSADVLVVILTPRVAI